MILNIGKLEFKKNEKDEAVLRYIQGEMEFTVVRGLDAYRKLATMLGTEDISELKSEALKRLRRKEGELGAYYYIDTYFKETLDFDETIKSLFIKEKKG